MYIYINTCYIHIRYIFLIFSITRHKSVTKVGSEFKIDCSYLSPNVSIATSIERSTVARDVFWVRSNRWRAGNLAGKTCGQNKFICNYGVIR